MDTSGVLQAAKDGDSDKFAGLLKSQTAASSAPAAKAAIWANKASVQAASSTSGGAGEGSKQLAAPAAAKKTAKTATAAKVTAVQWDGNTSLTFSEVLTILGDDGGALFGRAIASRLLLKQLLCFGRVNKACSKILRENLYKLLLCCRDVRQDPGELRKVGMQKLVCKYLYLTAYIYCEYLYLSASIV